MTLRAALLLALLFCAPLAIPQPNGGTIAGRVVLDDGRALPGIEVAIDRIGVSVGSEQLAVTDDEGGFKFTGLAPGLYQIEAEMPGYVVEGDENAGYRIGDAPTIRLTKGGAITGRVTDETGEPLVGVSVQPQWLRGLSANPDEPTLSARPRSTARRGGLSDDRGIYRIFGLPAGVYLVGVGGQSSYGYSSSIVSHDAPTWHPSGPRDTAAEITVPPGGEATGIDIRHRGERGRTVSGTLSGSTESPRAWGGATISLTSVEPGRFEAQAGAGTGRGFVFYGVPDGEYELEAYRWGDPDTLSAKSVRRRITVRGADVAGIDLKLSLLGAIAGRVSLEPKKCDPPLDAPPRQSSLEEISLRALPLQRPPGETTPSPLLSPERSRALPNEKGEFRVNDLAPGAYALRFDLPDENWFVRAVAPPPAPAPPTGLLVKSGERLSGVEIKLAEGAAGLRGALAGAKAPKRWRIHLLPAEPAAAGDLLRYFETTVDADGAFAFKHLAPGKYWVLARPAPDRDDDRPSAWDAIERAKLRREAEAAKNEVELQACRQVKGVVTRGQ